MGDTRYVRIPAEVQVLNPVTKEIIRIVEKDGGGKTIVDEPDVPWSIYRFLAIFVFQREEWQKPITQVRMQAKILDKFEDQPENAIVALPDELWRPLKKTLESEDFSLPFPHGRSLVHFADCIIDAPTENPAAKDDAPALAT